MFLTICVLILAQVYCKTDPERGNAGSKLCAIQTLLDAANLPSKIFANWLLEMNLLVNLIKNS